MKRLRHSMIFGTLFVVITGSLAHFLYAWSGKQPFIGLFSPVNESVWEHMKLIFFPMLLYTFAANRKWGKDYPEMASSLYGGILAGTIGIPVIFYGYTSILTKNFLFLDIGTFILCTAISFYIAYQFTRSGKLKPYTSLLCSLVSILFLCFLIFTYYPPDTEIFIDPTVSWQEHCGLP